MRELTELRKSLERLANFFVPSHDPDIFNRFGAFTATSKNGMLFLRGVVDPDPVTFAELKGIDRVITRLRENTEQFLEDLPCNNVLLHGPRGTGKSSAVKALLNEYRERGLRMIEMERDTLFHLFEIADMLRERREKFIVFCDDLSFEEEETTYRHLKAVLEGGIAARPRNMLIYATSNRRHLVPERQVDNLPFSTEGELHPADTLEEKLSLSDRFGLRLSMLTFDMETYLGIVDNYIALRKIEIDEEELKRKAIQWSLSHGSFSGRTARQFVDDLEGQMRMTGKKRAR